MKKTLLAAVFLGVSFWVYGLFFPFAGPWLDWLVSCAAGAGLPVSFQVRGAQLEHWSKVSFRSLAARSAEGRAFLGSGSGSARFSPRGFGGWQADVRSADVTLDPAFTRGASGLSMFFKSSRSPVVIQRVEIFVKKEGRFSSLHLLECVSEEVRGHGGARFEDGRPIKAQVRLCLAGGIWDRLPRQVSSRFAAGVGGCRWARLVFSRGRLRILGASGPFLEMGWQPADRGANNH